jgi:mannitol operon transcriptional antiterminator
VNVVHATTRQRQIIEILLKQRGEMTIAEIAEQLQVSPRTIHRTLQGIEPILEPYGVILSKKTGSGIQLIGEEEQLGRLSAAMTQLTMLPRTSLERMLLLLLKLLELKEPVKLFALSNDFQSAIPTISQDLDQLEKWMEKRKLTLVRKRGYGVEVVGTEADKRHAIAILADHHLDHSFLLASSYVYADPVSMKLAAMIGKEHFLKLEKLLWNWEEHDPTELSEETYTSMLIRISIAVKRYMEGYELEDKARLRDAHQAHQIYQDKLYTWFADEMNIELPSNELAYILQILTSGGGPLSEQQTAAEDLRVLHFVGQLIRRMSERMNIPFDQDQILREGLLQHMQRAYTRLYGAELVHNPLLAEIRRSYDELFQHVRSAISEIEDTPYVPDSEAAYLVLHFGASLERNRQSSMHVRALLVCTSGIGSSKMLAARISKEFPQIEILGNISWYEASRIPRDQYDVLISTVELPLPMDSYIRLSPLLSEDETERLSKFISDRSDRRLVSQTLRQTRRPTLSKLGGIAMLTQAVIEIIREFRLIPMHADTKHVTLQQVIRRMCGELSKASLLEKSEVTAARLLEQERNRVMLIPDRPLIFLHTRSPETDAPIFVLFRTSSAIVIDDFSPEPVSHLLMMIAPEQADSWLYEALSEFSALILQQDIQDALLSADEETIRELYAETLEQSILNKLEWSER